MPHIENGRQKKKRAYGTPDSHVVPHRSTDEACSGLTAQFGRDTVRFTEYGRRRMHMAICLYMKCVYWIVKRQSRLMMVPHWRTGGAAASRAARAHRRGQAYGVLLASTTEAA
jgi:hypothetical protein